MDTPNSNDEQHQENQPFLVYYDQGVYDLTDFAHKHPGGRNTLDGLRNRDIAKRMQSAPPHSEAAMYLMREYRVAAKSDMNNNSEETADSDTNPERLVRDQEKRTSSTRESDESMEVSAIHLFFVNFSIYNVFV